MSQLYKDSKEKFDAKVYGYLVKRLTEPYESTDAFGMGHIDEHGNEANPNEDWSYTKLDKLVFDLRAALGDGIKKIVKESFDGVDSMALMNSPVNPKEYLAKYDGIVKLVEEVTYLPDAQRGQGGQSNKTVDSGMTREERVSFALTVATAILTSMLKDRIVSSTEFDDEVLLNTEATFGIRSLGSANEVIGFLRSNGLSNGREITSEGIRLAYRISRVIVENNLVNPKGGGINNLAMSWVEVSRA
jgi:hypothetical protein